MTSTSAAVEPSLEILELARWAPSGDNTQPWRFVVPSPDQVVVLGHDTRDHCVYDLDGHPSQISIGALLETIALAATRFGMRARITRRDGTPEHRPVFDVLLEPAAHLQENPLVPHIIARRVKRGPLSTRPLSSAERAALEEAVGAQHRIVWFEGPRDRRRVAWLNFVSAKIRLTIPEAYAVHRDVIEWGVTESVDRIPAAALGASALTLHMMRAVMKSWNRVELFNRFLAGTVAPRVEMDLVPGLACAAHAVLVAHRPAVALDDYVAAGRALQRFWLTASSLGLQFQPEYTPLIFSRYAREGLAFTTDTRALRAARSVLDRVEHLLGKDVAQRAVFMGRIGHGPPATARSTRMPLSKLMTADSVQSPALSEG